MTFLRAFLLVLSTCFVVASYARVIVIDPGRAGTDVFSTFSAGYNDAVDGDTVHVSFAGLSTLPSSSSQLIEKGITIIGPGYDMDHNYPAAVPFAFVYPQIHQISFNTSSPAKLIGMQVKYVDIGGAAAVDLVSCKVYFRLFFHNDASGKVSRSYIKDLRVETGADVEITSSAVHELTRPGSLPARPLAVSHSIIYSGSGHSIGFMNSYVNATAFCNPTNSITHSVVPAISQCQHPTNLTVAAGQTVTFAVPSNVNLPDSLFRLTPNSIAIGAGFNGVDIGMFDGPEPYELSGIPSMPWIYEFEAPPAIAAPATNAQVTIKVKAID